MGKKRSQTRFGLALPEAAREKLRRAGIFVQTVVTIEHQHLAARYVVRGVESGGAIESFGHYVAFAAEDGSALPYVCRVESLAVNGPHSVVIAPVLTRAEMLRVRDTYELLITRHRPSGDTSDKRPTLVSEMVFRGENGYLAPDAGGLPIFWSRAGEPVEMPKAWRALVAAVLMGTRCIPCDHVHGAMPPATGRAANASGSDLGIGNAKDQLGAVAVLTNRTDAGLTRRSDAHDDV